MKKTIVLSLCLALVLAPLQSNSTTPGGSGEVDSSIMAICLIGAAAVAGGVIVFMLKTCKPKYYCVEDEDGKRFPSNATRSERLANDWKVKSGPYKDRETALEYCPPQTNTPPKLVLMTGLNNGEDEVFIPAVPLKIWKTTNLTHWILADTILDDPSHFSWIDTNAISGQAFYRVSY